MTPLTIKVFDIVINMLKVFIKMCFFNFKLRQTLNITPIQTGLELGRNARTRAAEKLVCFGQGHCHGVSSCMAAYLYVFAPLLGIDQR